MSLCVLTSWLSSNTGEATRLGVEAEMRGDDWICIGSGIVYHWLVGCSVFELFAESLLRELRRLVSFFLFVPVLELPRALCKEVVDSM